MSRDRSEQFLTDYEEFNFTGDFPRIISSEYSEESGKLDVVLEKEGFEEEEIDWLKTYFAGYEIEYNVINSTLLVG